MTSFDRAKFQFSKCFTNYDTMIFNEVMSNQSQNLCLTCE